MSLKFICVNIYKVDNILYCLGTLHILYFVKYKTLYIQFKNLNKVPNLPCYYRIYEYFNQSD